MSEMTNDTARMLPYKECAACAQGCKDVPDADTLERCAQWCEAQAKSDWYGKSAADMVRAFALLAAPAAPAPTDGFSAAVHQVRAALELCEPEDLAAFDFIITAITPPAPAPAPAAQADDAKLDAAFSDATNAAVALERRQSAAPAAPFAWTTEDEREPITDALKRARMDVYGKHYTVPLYRANPADAASEADDVLPLLRRLKRDLMHARRFGDDTLAAYRRACSSAEGDIEDYLRERQQGAQSNG